MAKDVSPATRDEIRERKEPKSFSGSRLPPRSLTTVMIFCLQDRRKERASAKLREGRTGASMSASPSTRAEGSEGKNV